MVIHYIYVKDWFRRVFFILNMHLFNSCTPSFKKEGLKINLFVSLKEQFDLSIVFHFYYLDMDCNLYDLIIFQSMQHHRAHVPQYKYIH